MLTGYTSALSARPGDRLEIFTSTDAAELTANVVRLGASGVGRNSMPNYREIPQAFLGTLPGHPQATRHGSCMRAPAPDRALHGGTLILRVWPSLPGHGVQGLADAGGLRLVLDHTGAPALLGPHGQALVTGRPLLAGEWHLLVAARDSDGSLLLHQRAVTGVDRPRHTAYGAGAPIDSGQVLLGALPGHQGPNCHFDGKLADPLLLESALSVEQVEALSDRGPDAPEPAAVAARWNLGAEPGGDGVRDTGPDGLHGTMVNVPMRAVTGPRWKDSIHDWRLDPDGYSAAHFHHDDLDDAGWAPTFSWEVPADARSGLYAARLAADDEVDRIPFAVVPATGADSAAVAVLLPTFTYLAYANERLGREMVDPGPGWYPDLDPLDGLVAEHPEWGSSLYDIHADGSGVCHSSLLRPIPSLRPDYRTWFVDGGRHLAGDLLLLTWLERQGIRFDLITDHDLDRDGVGLLSPYRVLITGGHPEYASVAMLDAIEGFIAVGGRLMYLGGNGFYWVTDVGGRLRHRIEVRRGQKGTRAWESAPGEQHQAISGEPGGLWRHRGRPPNRLTGVGFAAQGWDGRNRPYEATDRTARYPWVFTGVDTAGLICTSGHAMGAGAGDEVDRADPTRGTPRQTAVLASARGFSDSYQAVVEDVPEMHGATGGSSSPLVRADITLTAYENGGAVFATGSLAWSTGLEDGSGLTDAGRITGNVLRRFLDPDPVAGPAAEEGTRATEGSETG